MIKFKHIIKFKIIIIFLNHSNTKYCDKDIFINVGIGLLSPYHRL